MSKSALISLGILVEIVAFFVGYRYCYVPVDPSLLMLVTTVVLLFAGALIIVLSALSDNIHKIKSGKVIDHGFTAHHWEDGSVITVVGSNTSTPSWILTPGHQEPDTWSLRIEDQKGHKGWLHFEQNILESYPIGSFYPKK